ncbi:hypothetical protein N0V93_001620 [Gnomoniopsis smithogilvyi]|uniref:C2H2-type domain-containing protein n=1 Tax=Gnomoniopsis smithogilvyi TaxID=1191159 RepID=A0A9W8Z443_9PEZI|nr:hypothetical protein N0V93_001620 [Gnomoniopsis smithogilvyi]
MEDPVHADVANMAPRANVPSPNSASVPQLPEGVPSIYRSPQRLHSKLTTPTQTATVDSDVRSLARPIDHRVSLERQGPSSLLANPVASSDDKVPTATLAASLSPTMPPTEGNDSSQGPLPDWAYFYDPALSHSQVRYIESQMKPQEVYNKIPPDKRQSVVVDDLQQALSSMRQAYSRSTEVVANGMSQLAGAASLELGQSKTRSEHHHAQGIMVEGANPAGRTGGDDALGRNHIGGVVFRKRSISEAQRDDQAPTTHDGIVSATINHSSQTSYDHHTDIKQVNIAQHAAASHNPTHRNIESSLSEQTSYSSSLRSREEEFHNPARSSGSDIHGEMTANARPKRPRLQLILEADENGHARVVSSPSYSSQPAPLAHISDSTSHESAAGDARTSNKSELPVELSQSPSPLLDSSMSPESSDCDAPDNESVARDASGSGTWPPEDVARLLKAHENGHAWAFIQEILPKYSLPALQNKLKRIKKLKRSQLKKIRSPVSDDNTTMPKNENEPGTATKTMSVESSLTSELRDKRPDKIHLDFGEASTGPRPRDDGSADLSRSQGSGAISNANLGASRKGGVVIWFDEELQLLMDLKRQDKPWEEVFEAIPRHTCAAIRTKFSNIRQDPRWATKVQDDPLKKTVRPARRELFGKRARFTSSALQQRTSQQSEVFTTDAGGRLYSTVVDKSGRRQKDVSFLLLPGNYNAALYSDVPGLPWVCPIRSCRYAFHKSSSLDAHWARTHRKCLLNDNNDGTFSIKGDYEPYSVQLANALVISQFPLDAQEPPMVEARSYRQVQMEKEEYQPSSESRSIQIENQKEESMTGSRHNRVSDESGVSGQVIIPKDLTMATTIRSYREWPDKDEFHFFRSNYCSLGGHFSAAHPGSLLNDNGDGTFTEFGRQDHRGGKQDHRTTMIKSKIPLFPGAPPRAEPNASPHNTQAQINLAASIAEWEKNKAARPLKAKPTMDEILARRISSAAQSMKEDIESSELSDAVTSSDSDAPGAEVTSAGDSEVGGTIEPVDNETGVDLRYATDLTSPFARENWDIIQGLFTEKRFPPPQSGPLKELLSLRRVRDIELNPTATKKFSILWPKDASLVIVQLTGPESPTNCKRCSNGYGIFSSCVVVPQDVANVLQSGICACVNCSWKSVNHKSCDVKKLLKTAGGATAPSAALPQNNAMEASLPIADTDSSDDGGIDSDQPLGPRRSERPLRIVGNEDGQNTRTRHSMRLKSNVTQNDVRGQITLKPTAPRAKDVEKSAVAESPKLTQITKVDKSFSFRVDVVTPRTTLRIQPDVENIRICSLVMGKVTVKVRGEQTFDIGFQGMFRLLPGVDAEVMNLAGFDAVLQISSFRER